MDQSLLVLGALLPVILVIAAGALLRRIGVLQPDLEKGMMALVVQVLLPALTLANIAGNASLKSASEVATVAGFGFGGIVIGCLIAYGAAGLLRMERGHGKRTFGVSVGIQNYGYMGMPLLVSLFPGDGVLGVLFTHNLGVDIALWTLGVALMSGERSLNWRLFMKPPIIAVVVGLSMNALGLGHAIDGPVRNALQMLGAAAVPLALLVIGAGLCELLMKDKFDWRVALGAIAVRLVVIPACMLLAAYLLPLSDPLKQVVVIQAAMPAAMFPIIMAKHYGGKPEVAVQAVVATTVVCFLTMPFVIVYGMHLLGL